MLFNFVFMCLFWLFVAHECDIVKITDRLTRREVSLALHFAFDEAKNEMNFRAGDVTNQ